ncbi:hypothetical protein ANCDUO_14912 [Ancylostoma duodenale]|uniref:NTR domain-containing protein n=1 Tax=Ancylostoma duodenale TaxID=51022 RepID=A0A0C2G7S3_9BILA|nr:hypothetical protein ANCDUO_14912 [Ancylostoma duodenale]
MAIDGDRKEPGKQLKYTIWHLHTWKGYDKVKDNATSILTTPSSDDQCGVTNLVEEADYFLSGKLQNGEIYITNCNLVLPYEYVTRDDVDLLRDLRDGVKQC